MPANSLVLEAEREYQLLQHLESKPECRQSLKLYHEKFDFSTAEEMSAVPLDIVEGAREDQRRRGIVDRDASRLDFIKRLGMEEADTRDPVNGYSALEVKESVRAYYGDLDDTAYRTYRFSILDLVDDEQWLKVNRFLGSNVELEYLRLQRRRDPKARELKMTLPVTHFREDFYEAAARRKMEKKKARNFEKTSGEG